MKRFSIVENGYDIDEVNRFIDIVIGRLEKLNAENAAYVAKIDKLNLKLQEDRPNEEKLEKAIEDYAIAKHILSGKIIPKTT